MNSEQILNYGKPEGLTEESADQLLNGYKGKTVAASTLVSTKELNAIRAAGTPLVVTTGKDKFSCVHIDAQVPIYAQAARTAEGEVLVQSVQGG